MDTTRPTTAFQRWRFALKPASWRKLIAPTALGHCLGASQRGGLDLELLVVGGLLTPLLLAAIVLLNDFADREVDATKRRMFPTSSRKTIPDGVLPAHHVLFAGALAALGFLVAGYFVGDWSGRAYFFPACCGALALFLAYSVPPIKLNYRGGGELLEMFGVGVALPWLHAYLQAGLGASFPWIPKFWPLLIPLALLALASAIASGLSDEASDKRGGKRTIVTLIGNLPARGLIEKLVLVAAITTALLGFLTQLPLAFSLAAAAVLLFQSRGLLAASASATRGNFHGIRLYKASLHKGIWTFSDACAFGLLLLPFFG